MMQQLSFSPVENILTVLFAAAILGYLLYLLVRSLRNRQRGYHTVNRAKVYSKAQATAVNQPVYLARLSFLKIWKKRANRSPWKFPTESTANCRKAIVEVSAAGTEN